MNQSPRRLRTTEVAAWLGKSVYFVRQEVKAGRLRPLPFSVGGGPLIFDEDEVRRFAESPRGAASL